jgi:hypothetical protein
MQRKKKYRNSETSEDVKRRNALCLFRQLFGRNQLRFRRNNKDFPYGLFYSEDAKIEQTVWVQVSY